MKTGSRRNWTDHSLSFDVICIKKRRSIFFIGFFRELILILIIPITESFCVLVDLLSLKISTKLAVKMEDRAKIQISTTNEGTSYII